MINIKRQFLDFLYDNKNSCKKTFKLNKNGYFIKLSAGELLKEIDNKTEIGTYILDTLDQSMETQNLVVNIIKDNNDINTEN